MIIAKDFFEILISNGISFFTGVPDSLLKNFCAYVTDNVSKKEHIINSSEGAAVALAAGYYLASGKTPLVYMQNSGLGNAVNPLLSLTDKEVYSIPVLLLIGWRGEPGIKDEPQHKKQGRVMLDMLDAMEIPYWKINKETKNADEIVREICKELNSGKNPCALIISEGTFEEYKLKNDIESDYPLNREDAVKIILNNLNENELVVSTTGKTSREVFEYRKENDQRHQNDFLTVGSMGHCSQIALGISLQKKERDVFVLDGDGAVIMQMGSLAISGCEGGKNFKHIVINNGSHDSVGGQPTAGFEIDLTLVAEACGYELALTASTEKEIIESLSNLKLCNGPSFLEIRVKKGARNNLGRPDISPSDNKINFMNSIS